MMHFPKVTGPTMPKKAKKTGIGGAIGRVLEKVRSAGRPEMGEGIVPGAPATRPKRKFNGVLPGRKNKTLSVDDDERPTFTDDQRRAARAKGAAQPPVNQRTRTYSFGRRRGGGT